jgi:CheY-like chemotaxis protein
MTSVKNAQIVWVDDDIDDIRYLLYPLEKEGARINKVANLSEAADVIARSHNLDLVVLDLLMPSTDRYGKQIEWIKSSHSEGANGINLLIRIREHMSKQVPVLILSVVPDAIEEMDIDPAYKPVDFVHKSSMQISTILDKVREMLSDDESE